MKRDDDLPELTELADEEMTRIKEGFAFASSFQQRELHRSLLLEMDPGDRSNNQSLVSFRTSLTDKSLLFSCARSANTSVSALCSKTIHDALPHIYHK